ncbi:MAG: hypothetical protein J6T35_03865, partial [Bacteroidales bacterium]|nr:hypothetical protein [Bacteroidales bacterium]
WKARVASEVGAAARATQPSSGAESVVRTTQPSLSLGVSFNNLFNQSYQIVQGYPMPGFHMMFSVTFKW